MPYKDIFDHKGPLLYILNYLGDSIFGNNGVWFIELIFIFVFFLIVFKICALKCDVSGSLIITSTMIIPLLKFYDGGNLTEEYSLPFISLSIYIFICFIFYNHTTTFRIFVCGVCLGAVLLLRPNMIPIWIVFPLYIIYENKEKLHFLIYCIFFFLLGLISVLLPIFIWLLLKGAFIDFINDYIIFNFMYVVDKNLLNAIWKKLNSLTFFLTDFLTLLSLFLLIFILIKRKEVKKIVIYIATLTLSLVAISISGRTYLHYGMILIPLFPFPIALFLGSLIKPLNYSKLGFIILISFPLLNSLHALSSDFFIKFNHYRDGQRSALTKEQRTVIDIIKSETLPDDRILVLGNRAYIYLLSNRLSSSKYAYQSFATINEKFKNSVIEDLKKNKPKILIIVDKNNKMLEDLVDLNGYIPIFRYNDKYRNRIFNSVLYKLSNDYSSS